MSELDNLKDDGEKYAQDHPDQVKEGEQDVEKKLGVPGQTGSGSTDNGDNGQDSGNQQQ